MIKLIVTDLDGTLLTPEHRVPEGFLPFAEKLLDRGLRIAAISGREGFHVEPHFPGLADRILIAANNGSVFFDGGKPFARNPLPMDLIREVSNALVGIPKLSIVLSGEKHSYMWEKTVSRELVDAFAEELSPEEINLWFPVYEDPFRAAIENQDYIGKIALYHPVDSEKASRSALAPFQSVCQICASEPNWVNIMAKGIEKGLAVRRIQEYLGVTPEETMTFGDYLNDLGMFRYAKYSYAMANGHPDLKAVARSIAPSNAEAGVLQVLRREFPL